jgi:hypothetical protein
MRTPSFLEGESLTRLLQGIAAGAIARLINGFYWGGRVTGGTAKQMVQKSAETAVVSALAPICVDKFQHQADATASLTELKKISSWQQGSFIGPSQMIWNKQKEDTNAAQAVWPAPGLVDTRLS